MIELNKSHETLLDEKTRELIAIGASVAGNCMPCLRYHFAEAVKWGCSINEIREAVDLAKRVKERPINDIYSLSDELIKKEKTKEENDE